MPTGRPTLVWQPVPRARQYRVQMFHDGEEVGQAPLWQTTVAEGPLEYPAWETELGSVLRCRWRVVAVFGDKQEQTIVDSRFQVATAGEIAALADVKPLLTSCRPADWLVGALILESHRAYGQAFPLWERLGSRFPQEANVHLRLAEYYTRAGRPELASMARTRAKKLGQPAPD